MKPNLCRKSCEKEKHQDEPTREHNTTDIIKNTRKQKQKLKIAKIKAQSQEAAPTCTQTRVQTRVHPGACKNPKNLIKPMLFQHFAPPNPGANPGASKTSRKAAHNKKPPSSLFLYSGKCSLIHHANPKVRPHPSFSGVDLLDLVQKRTHCCLLRFKRLVLNFRESSSTTTGTQSPSGTPCHCVRLIMCACLCLFHVCFERMTSEA